MYKLIIHFIIWSCLGRLIRSIARISIIYTDSFNAYLSYIEKIWHFDSPKLFKTLYFNFRLCDFHHALKCPIYIYGRTRTWNLGGKVHFETDDISSGMIKWGYDWGYRSNGVTIIRIEGDITFKGPCLLAQASDIAVFPNASLIIGGGGKILENTLIYCTKAITIGENFSFTFQSSMMDTDFHYMVDINSSRIAIMANPINIGDNVWIGNRATIKKGVVIPDNTIVAASYSVLTKDYSNIPPYSILGGCPAKLIASGYSRVWKNELKNAEMISHYFEVHPNEKYLKLEKKRLFDFIYECE